MPRARKPARLWLRPAADDRESVWVILDGGKQIRTGCSALDRSGAERALERHLAARFIAEPKAKDRSASEITLAEVIANYLNQKKATARRPRELAGRAEALLQFWGDKTLDDVTSAACEAYAASRTTASQARRELEDMRSAISLAIADGLTRQSVRVTLPEKSKGRANFMERDAVAKLLLAAYRKRETYKGRPTKKKVGIHIARFILVALYTGSRSARVWQASFMKEQGRPYVDVEAGLYYRAWEGERVARNKRAPPIRLPPRLVAHLRRWRRMGANYVVEYQGRAADPKKAFARHVKDVFGEGSGVMRHTFRHTAATWLMQSGEDPFSVSGYLGMSHKTLETTYGHHHPDHQASIGSAFSSGRAGRVSRGGR